MKQKMMQKQIKHIKESCGITHQKKVNAGEGQKVALVMSLSCQLDYFKDCSVAQHRVLEKPV